MMQLLQSWAPGAFWSTRLSRSLGHALAITVLAALPAAAESPHSRIVNGLNTHDFPATGALLVGANADEATSWCSGTLIGCNTFLTAAHCVENDSDPSGYQVFFQHAGMFSVTSLHSHPSYLFPTADVAVLALGETVTGIEPVPLNLTNPQNHFGTTGQIAGFGRSGGSADDYGIKRWGEIETKSCTSAGYDNDTLVCWAFTNPLGNAGEDSNTCNGDSGGPLFLDLGAGRTIAGITSGGDNANCLPTDNSYDANVYNYLSFIQQHLGSDSTSACGSVPAVGTPQVQVSGFEGNLGSGGISSASHSVNVGTGRQQLRITMNSEDNGSFDVDLYVKQGSAPTTGNYDCARAGSGPHGACNFDNPTAGPWHVLVDRYSGNGEYQVTISEFGGEAPICGDNSAEGNEECDGTDDSACPGECLPNCTCPAPVAGNCDSAPKTDCREPPARKGKLVIGDNASDSKDKMTWIWALGSEPTEMSDFSDPAAEADTELRLCIYDASGSGAPGLISGTSVAGITHWRETNAGFLYKDPTLANGGTKKILLNAKNPAKAKLKMQLKGVDLDTPSLPLQPPVKAQLIIEKGGNHVCWESNFGTARVNTDTRFKGLSD